MLYFTFSIKQSGKNRVLMLFGEKIHSGLENKKHILLNSFRYELKTDGQMCSRFHKLLFL